MPTEHPLYTRARAALCPTARYVGGISRWLCECPEPHACPGVHPPIVHDSWTNEEEGEPGFVDRYTVVPQHGEFAGNGDTYTADGCIACFMYLGCSQGGRAFSQWGELAGPYNSERYAHLGRRVELDDLDPDTLAHIRRRLTEEH